MKLFGKQGALLHVLKHFSTIRSLIEKNFKREVAKDSSKSNFSSPLASSSPSMLQSSVVSKMTVEDIPKLALGRQAMLARQIAERVKVILF